MSEERDRLFAFPCSFPLKIMGLAHAALAPEVAAVVLRHAADFDAATMSRRASSGGKYVSLTCTINATSRAQLDALYQELSSHSLVKIVL